MALAVSLRALAVDITVLPDEKLQQRYEALTHELRCMQCMNNSIADSPVGLASDLRREVKEQLIAGKTDDEIRAYMVQRYGNVILFTPPLNASSAWVWLLPVLAALAGLIIGVRIVRQRGKLVEQDDSVIDAEERPHDDPRLRAHRRNAGGGRGRAAAAAAAATPRRCAPGRRDGRRRRAASSLLLGGAGLYAAFSNYGWVDTPAVADTPAAMTARLAERLAHEPGKLEDWLLLGRSYAVLEQYPLAIRAYQRADRMANGPERRSHHGRGRVDAGAGFSTNSAAPPASCSNARWNSSPAIRKALFYSAFAALARGELPLARERFQRMLALNPPPEVRAHHREAHRGHRRGVQRRGLRRPQPLRACSDARADRGARHAGAGAGRQGARRARRLFVAARDPKSPGPPFAVKRLPAQFPGGRGAHGRRCHAGVAPHRGGPAARSGGARGARWHADRDAAATRSDKLAIMSARTES